MKIIHTSDWHIGKKLNGRSRLSEQAEILNEIIDIADAEKADLVLVAGDIFDTSVPSAEAEELFFKTAMRLASNNRAVVVISGNHDDYLRLSACRDFASRSNVYIFGGGDKPPVGNDENNVYAEKTGKYHCVINAVKKSGDKVYLGLLPYPCERAGEVFEGDTFEQKTASRINACFKGNDENLPAIFMAHIFMLGGTAGESERAIELGGTRLVDKKLVPEFCVYTALGHLHKRQIISRERNMLYSGSIAGYAFDEAGIEKSVTSFELKNGKAENIKAIALKKGKKLVNLVAANLEDGKKLLQSNSDCLVKLTLKLNHALSEKESKELAGDYPALVELNLQIAGGDGYEKETDRRTLSEKEAFEEYYKNKFDENPPADLMTLYLELMGDGNETA